MAFSAPVHRPVFVEAWSDRKRGYVAARPSPSRIYGRQWQKLRAAKLAADPLCEVPGCGHAATVVHHKHGREGELMYLWDNLESMCKPHHDSHTAKVDGGFGNKVKR